LLAGFVLSAGCSTGRRLTPECCTAASTCIPLWHGALLHTNFKRTSKLTELALRRRDSLPLASTRCLASRDSLLEPFPATPSWMRTPCPSPRVLRPPHEAAAGGAAEETAATGDGALAEANPLPVHPLCRRQPENQVLPYGAIAILAAQGARTPSMCVAAAAEEVGAAAWVRARARAWRRRRRRGRPCLRGGVFVWGRGAASGCWAGSCVVERFQRK
jgi:hypothetical protein